ncbi:MAG: hypothetical protein B1H07_03985 [Campylobacteraceae bacterium 4484_166]|nr:MAG: hypothetical protein B1H07_03985 [Campylobacteraceae bacterium 4484_166]
MNLKENVDYIKHEMGTQEEFLSGFFKLEKYYKKYKNFLFIIAGVVVVLFLGNIVANYIKDENTKKANIAFNKLLIDKNDKEALATLKETNNLLYNIAQYQQDKSTKINDELQFLKQLALYSSQPNLDLEQIDKLLKDENLLLKDYLQFRKALILTKNGEFKKAKTAMKFIPKDSPVAELSVLLSHYLSTK